MKNTFDCLSQFILLAFLMIIGGCTTTPEQATKPPNRTNCNNVSLGSESHIQAERKESLIDISHKLHALSATLGHQALLASYGFPDELRLLRESRDNFDSELNEFLKAMQRGDKLTWSLIHADIFAIRARWSGPLRMKIDQILSQEKRLLALPSHVHNIQLATNRLLEASDEVVEIGALHGVTTDLLYLSQGQGTLGLRLQNSAIIFGQTLTPESDSSKSRSIAAAQLKKDMELIKSRYARLREKMPKVVTPKLNEVGVIIEEIDHHTTSILNSASEIYVSQLAANMINEQSNLQIESTRRLVEKLVNGTTNGRPSDTRTKGKPQT